MNFWKNHTTLRGVLIVLFFVIGMVLTIAGWKMTGQLKGLGIMLVGESGEIADLIKKNWMQGHKLDLEHIAKELGDKVTYTDYEIYSAIMSLCIRRYEVKNPSLLDKDAKIEVAKIMHFDYNASNKQIKRVLRLDDNVIETLFPR